MLTTIIAAILTMPNLQIAVYILNSSPGSVHPKRQA